MIDNYDYLPEALNKLVPNAKYIVQSYPEYKLEWLDKRAKPSDYDINKQIKIIENYSNAIINRQKEYPSIQEQLDDLFHIGAFSKEMTEKIQTIKNKYPID
jgi:hypothetical protein